MGEPNRRLPRLPNADKPRPDESVLKQGGADLQNEFAFVYDLFPELRQRAA